MKKMQGSKGEWLIWGVVALAFLIRLWPLGYVAYEGDGQEISRIAYGFIHEGKIPLYGYSVSNFYEGHYGPAPFYLFSLFALLSTAPFSAVLFIILLSTATTYVLYRIGRDFWNRSVGFIAALLFAVSHFSVVTSREAYSVNIAPVFFSLFLYSLLALVNKKKPAYYWLLFFSAGIIFQIHITAFPVLVLAIPALVFGMPRNRKWILIGCGILVILFLPYLYEEASNGFAETRQLLQVIGALRGGEKMTATSDDWGSFFLQYVNPFEIRANPFHQNIANMKAYFCEDPAQHSRLAGFIGGALRISSAVAWLLFPPLLLYFGVGLVRKRKESDSIEFKGSILLLIWFFSSVMLESILPWHIHYHFHSLSISTILLWAVGFGWLLPSLAGRHKPAICRLTLLFVLSLVIVNSMGWTVLHISNPQKDCIFNTPSLSALEDIAEVLAEDQRFLQQPDEILSEILSLYNTPPGKLYGLPFVVMDAVRRREQGGGQFANLSGRYILVREQSLPFRLAPALSVQRIGTYTLIRQLFLINTSSLVMAKAGDAKDIESARRIARGQIEQWPLGKSWPPPGVGRCSVECPLIDFDSPDCQRCLGNSTLYLRILLSGNRTTRTALVVNEFVGAESHMIGAIYLNDEPLFYDGRLLVAGESLRPQEALMDVTGRLNESPNVLEVLLFSRPGHPKGKHVRPDIFTISGE